MRRLHPLSAVPRVVNAAVRAGSTAFFLVVVLTFVTDAVTIEWVFVLGPLAALAGLGYGVARYYRFTYALEGDTLSVASGVVDRQERDIPLGRIQNVDVRRGLLQRAMGLATVRFETAGGSATEAVLDAVSVAEADRLQEAVARHRRSDAEQGGAGDRETVRPTGESEATEETGHGGIDGATDRGESVGPDRHLLYELSTGDLLLYGLLSFRPAAPALTLFSVPFLEDVVWAAIAAGTDLLGGPSRLSFEVLPGLSPGDLSVVAVVAGVQFLVVSWALSAALTVVGYYDFRLERVGEDLRYERGLLQRFSGSIPLEKVQTVTVRENALMRQLGYGALAIETAGYAAGNGGGASNTAVPFDARETVREFAERLGPVDPRPVERPPKRARRRYAVRFTLVPALAAIALAGVDRYLLSIRPWPLVFVLVLAAPVAGHLAWRHRGHALADRGFVARSGFWVRQTRLVPYFRIQTVIDTRTVFQRYRDLASVTADTASSATLAGGGATAHDVDDATARHLHRTLRERLAADLDRRRVERRRRDGVRGGPPATGPTRESGEASDSSPADAAGDPGERDGDGT